MADAVAVMDAAGSRRALLGHDAIGPLAILFAATYPERTSALILYWTYASGRWSPDSGDVNIYNMAGGTFTPYPEIDVRLCSGFYPTRQSYTDAITEATEYAVAQRWILPEEAESIVAGAEQKALEFPGCVPGVS